MTETDAYHDLHFSVCRSIRYHTYRESFFRRVLDVCLFPAFLAATTSIATFGEVVAADWPMWAKASPSAAVSFLIAIPLFFRVNEKALLHGTLKQGFIHLQQQMETNKTWDGDDMEKFLADITVQRLAIESREPKVLRVLDVVCRDELMRSLGYSLDDESYVQISWYQRWFKQWKDIHPHKLATNAMKS